MKQPLLLSLAHGLMIVPAFATSPSLEFDFGQGQATSSYTAVRAGDRFSDAKGYGFDLSGHPVDRPGHVTGNGGFYFSVDLPEGNYEVTLMLGDESGPSDTTVKAESRRLMLDSIRTRRGQIVTEKFTVNIRRPEIEGSAAVRLKDREKPYLHWDSKLTLEFNGSRPCVDRLQIRPAPAATTLYLLGDSTVTDQPYEPWNSWGQMLPCFFGPGVAVANHAESGETLRSSLSARRVQKVYRSLKSGDYVLVQFGHNDMKSKSPDALKRYQSDLAALVDDVRKHGARPILITSMERKAGVNKDTLGGYPDAVRTVAGAKKVPVIDLHAMSRELYQALGKDLDAAFQDGSHHNNFGSYELARCVVEGLRTAAPGLSGSFRPGVGKFDPAAPDRPEDFQMPASPVTDLTKPDGN
ncbi:rhamnogalacturonan acetylesterase [Luteolibacter marinus]|uniref:rhamnogalacturonan acetylesterase n=1 Tax=Luteolibacter marinus TaxID=2776705 RepID=UPI001865DD4B|nr:rhamnogalacturonan acetylesterase [Luteolibacter marinus]